MTGGQFEDYLSGCIERENEQRLNAGIVASWIAKTMGGVTVHPMAFVDPEYEFGDNPLSATETPEEKYRRKLAVDERQRLKRWRHWLRRSGLDPSRFE